MSNNLPKNKSGSRLKNRRGVADVISTMMLMAVTVTGASTLTYFMNDAFLSGNLGTISTLESSSLNLLLLAYDTRDSSGLLTVSDVDNDNINTKFLCGITCSVNTNAIPTDTPGGTEFIVLRIQNNGLDVLFFESVSLNGVVHYWDSSTSTIPLDASTTFLGLSDRPYPSDGMFSILPIGANPIQKENIQIQSGEVVNILVKLGPNDSDISLSKGIHVLFNTGGIQPVDFLIESGTAK